MTMELHRVVVCVTVALLWVGCGSDNARPGDPDGGGASTDEQPSVTPGGVVCAPGFTCAESPDSDGDVVWVMKDDGNVNGPSCSRVCEAALPENCAYHACAEGLEFPFQDAASLAGLANNLGFDCRPGGCWDSVAPGEGMMLVSIVQNDDGTRSCYFPEATQASCNSNPGNANCFGERYASLCPCVTRPLEEACTWSCDSHDTTVATWRTEGTSCLERINYWRKRACEEGWVECPPSGLPPMSECTACHECANTEAAYDKQNGAHASFKRCGESSQGEGGGPTCADVIDGFVSERAPDEEGVMRCQGHCGPILKPGCRSFSWGKDRDSGFHTLNWGGCNAEKCQAYCDENPRDCYTVETSPDGTCHDPASSSEEGPIIAACQ